MAIKWRGKVYQTWPEFIEAKDDWIEQQAARIAELAKNYAEARELITALNAVVEESDERIAELETVVESDTRAMLQMQGEINGYAKRIAELEGEKDGRS